jgi:cytochrome c oxidase subunit 2
MLARMRQRPALWLTALTVVFSILGELVVWWAIGFTPTVASTQGEVVDEAIALLAYLVVPVFVFITLVTIFAMTVWRVPEDDDTDSDSQPRTSRRVVLAWTGSTAALAVFAIIDPGVTGILDITRDAEKTPDTLDIKVTAQQWDWSFEYPQLGVTFTDTLYLPLNRRVRFVMTSKDVIHSFWIPSMRVKKDVIPGENRELFLTPTRVTSTDTDAMTRLQCAELCGVGHAQMWSPVAVVPEDEFDQWATEQAKKPKPMEM